MAPVSRPGRNGKSWRASDDDPFDLIARDLIVRWVVELRRPCRLVRFRCGMASSRTAVRGPNEGYPAGIRDEHSAETSTQRGAPKERRGTSIGLDWPPLSGRSYGRPGFAGV